MHVFVLEVHKMYSKDDINKPILDVTTLIRVDTQNANLRRHADAHYATLIRAECSHSSIRMLRFNFTTKIQQEFYRNEIRKRVFVICLCLFPPHIVKQEFIGNLILEVIFRKIR